MTRPNDRVPGAEILLHEDDSLAASFEIVEVAAPDKEAEASQTVAVLVEDEQRMVAPRLEVTVVGRLLLGAVDRALGAVDIGPRW